MRLERVEIEGYRSIKEKLELHVDSSVTVVLGANDHGKSNLLEALRHLNEDSPFDPDRDLNWDCEDKPDALPRVQWTFALDEAHKQELIELDHALRSLEAADEFQKEIADQVNAAAQQLQGIEADIAQKNAAVEEAEVKITASEDASATPEQAEQLPQLKAERDAARQAADEQSEKALPAARAELERLDLARDRSEARLIELRASLDTGSTDQALERELAAAGQALNEAQAAHEVAAGNRATAQEELEAAPSDADRQKAVETAEKAVTRATNNVSRAQERGARASRAATVADRLAEADDVDGLPKPVVPKKLTKADIADTLTVHRTGVNGELEVEPVFGHQELAGFVRKAIPRVELIPPTDHVPDSVSAAELRTENFAFMRGIFHYAGLRPDEWDKIFDYGGTASKRLEDASQELTKTLRASWRQGEQLSFKLDHDSKKARIDLWINDPAVDKGFTLASRRSAGFTHFFSLKTILHAHEMERPASSYIWVFDEPGLHLHPDGQHDLVQVLETLAQSNQVIYSTHSIFMANKNFPVRHRLITKDKKGTRLDGKPFRSRWKPALGALGLSMPGSLLFASRVLLVEGDSDVILVNALLQKLIELGRFDYDINHLAVMATGTAPDAAALIRILGEMASPPQMALLVDGDDGGKKRSEYLKDLLDEKKIGVLQLSPEKTTTEDHLPGASRLFVKAMAVFLSKLKGVDTSADQLETELKDEATQQDVFSAKGLSTGLAGSLRSKGQALAGLDSRPSPLGTAREYAILLENEPPDSLSAGDLKRAEALAGRVAEQLKLPLRVLAADEIVAE